MVAETGAGSRGFRHRYRGAGVDISRSARAAVTDIRGDRGAVDQQVEEPGIAEPDEVLDDGDRPCRRNNDDRYRERRRVDSDDVPGCTSVAGLPQVPALLCRYESATETLRLPPAPATHFTWIWPVGAIQAGFPGMPWPKSLSRSPQALPSRFDQMPLNGAGNSMLTGGVPAGTGVVPTEHVSAPVGARRPATCRPAQPTDVEAVEALMAPGLTADRR